MNRNLQRAFVLVAMLALVRISARAEAASASSSPGEGREIRFAPIFIWAPINSTSASEGGDPPEDVTEGQTGLNGAYGMRLEIESGRSIGSTEMMYASLTDEWTSASGVQRSLDYKILLTELYGGYEVVDSLSIIGGIRYYALDLDYTSSTPTSIDRESSLLDPVVGVWYRPRLSKSWTAALGADVGGLGLGFDISSSVFATFTWRSGKRFGADVGYRALYLKKSTRNDYLETTLYGPVFGFEIYF